MNRHLVPVLPRGPRLKQISSGFISSLFLLQNQFPNSLPLGEKWGSIGGSESQPGDQGQPMTPNIHPAFLQCVKSRSKVILSIPPPSPVYCSLSEARLSTIPVHLYSYHTREPFETLSLSLSLSVSLSLSSKCLWGARLSSPLSLYDFTSSIFLTDIIIHQTDWSSYLDVRAKARPVCFLQCRIQKGKSHAICPLLLITPPTTIIFSN